MIVIVATLKAKAGKEEGIIRNMNALVKAVRINEPGNMEYVFHRSLKTPAVFMVYEKYKSGEAVQSHMSAKHFQDAARKFPETLDGAMTIETYSVIE